MSPARLNGAVALFTSLGIYSYLPYIALYTSGPTLPAVAGLLSAVYGLNKYKESGIVNSIQLIEEG
jgi:hypothetical protein